jgi:hypothetical protein
MSPGACYTFFISIAAERALNMYFLRTFSLALFFCGQPLLSLAQSSGFVYIATNSTSGNVVIQYSRGNDGSLTNVSEAATGGLGGSGNGVGNLDPLV